MHELSVAPDGHLWIEDLAERSGKDINTIGWLCEQELIQAVKIGDRWAVRVVQVTTPQTGTAIVRDLKAGRDISIGSVIGQYIVQDGKNREKDRQRRLAQAPIREVIDESRKHLKFTWYTLGGGAMFALIGIVLSWPVASLMIIPAYEQAKEAVMLAEQHGDSSLVEEAHQIETHARITAIVLWTVMAFVGMFLLLAISGG